MPDNSTENLCQIIQYRTKQKNVGRAESVDKGWYSHSDLARAGSRFCSQGWRDKAGRKYYWCPGARATWQELEPWQRNLVPQGILFAVVQYPILCDPMDCSKPGFKVRSEEWYKHFSFFPSPTIQSFVGVSHETLTRNLLLRNMTAIICLGQFPGIPGGLRVKGDQTSLLVQRLRLCTPNAGGLSLIPGQGARSHVLQLRVHMLQLRPGASK